MSVGVLLLSDKMIIIMTIIMIISFVFAWKKEQRQTGGPRFYWNIIYDKFAGLKGQCHQFCKHTLCLAPLFVREGVVNRVGDVVCVCGRAPACAGALLVMCLHLLWPCYLVCRIN